MSAIRILIVVVILIAAFILLILSFTTYSRRKVAGLSATFLSLSLFAVFVYTFGYAMELVSDSAESVFMWVRFEHLGIQAIAPTWLLFTIYQTGREKWVNTPRAIGLFILPLGFFLAVQTLGNLNFMHPNARLEYSGLFPVFTYDRTIMIYLSVAYQSILLAISTVLFSIMLIKSARPFRYQAVIFWLGSMVPWIGGIIYNLGLAPFNLDITPLSLTISSILLSIGFLKFHMLDIVPMARDRVFEGMGDGVLVLDNQDRIVDYNSSLAKILEDIKPVSIGKIVHSQIAKYPELLKLINDPTGNTATVMVNKPDKAEYFTATRTAIKSKTRQIGLVISLHPYTEVKELLDKLEELASRDALTGLYNRRFFFQMAEQEIQRTQRYGGVFALVIMDLDLFKQINDTYGHPAGDEVLKKAGSTIISMLRSVDMIGRFGGEEFVIMLPQTDREDAKLVTERIRVGLEHLDLSDVGVKTSVTASFGVAVAEGSKVTSLEDILWQADQALYLAKSQGRNRVCIYDPDGDVPVLTRK